MIDVGQQVETMVAEGRKIVADAIAEHRPVAIIAAFSGGDDSIVSTHFAMANVPGCVVFNAHTLVGLTPTRAHIAAVCERFGWPIEIYRAEREGKPKPFPASEWVDGETAYEECVLNFGFAGPAMHARMYQRLKERPLARLMRDLKGGKRRGRILIVSGIRHDESARRAGYNRATMKVPGKGQVWVNPFYFRSAVDFEVYRQEFGLPRNPVKRLCGISGECCCGAFGKPAVERPAYRQVDPMFADYLDALEARVRERFPWGWGERPPKWWADRQQGQRFLLDMADGPEFQPMCVGCNSGRR